MIEANIFGACIETGFLLYLYNSVLGYFGFSLFAWWWLNVKSASFVFKCVTLIFLFWGIQNSLAAVSRFLFLTGEYESLHSFFNSAWWIYTTLPTTTVFTVIVIAMIFRIRKTLKEKPKL